MRVLIAVLAVFAMGCATLINGTTQTVQVTSYPSGATGKIYRARTVERVKAHVYKIERIPDREAVASLTTPAMVRLKRGAYTFSAYIVELETEDGVQALAAICNRRNNTTWWNVFWLFPLVIPAALIDMFSGANWTLESYAIGVALDRDQLEPPICPTL